MIAASNSMTIVISESCVKTNGRTRVEANIRTQKYTEFMYWPADNILKAGRHWVVEENANAVDLLDTADSKNWPWSEEND